MLPKDLGHAKNSYANSANGKQHNLKSFISLNRASHVGMIFLKLFLGQNIKYVDHICVFRNPTLDQKIEKF